MELDLHCFLKQLKELPASPFDPGVAISDYVRAHIYEPLHRDEIVCFSDLDFDAFDSEDLDTLEALMGEYTRRTFNLINLNRKFCEIDPASASAQIFC